MPFLRGQQVNSGRPISLIEDASYHNEAFIDHEYPGDLYTQTDDMLPALIRAYESERPTALQDMLPILVPSRNNTRKHLIFSSDQWESIWKISLFIVKTTQEQRRRLYPKMKDKSQLYVIK